MSAPISGQVTALIIAGHLEAADTKPNNIGHRFIMAGSSVTFYIKPEVAKQWISVLETIAAKEDN